MVVLKETATCFCNCGATSFESLSFLCERDHMSCLVLS